MGYSYNLADKLVCFSEIFSDLDGRSYCGLLFATPPKKFHMKKLSVLALALVASTALFAQGPKFGAKAGLNVSKLTNSAYDWRAGFHGGLLSHIHLTPAFSLQPEIMYSGQGAKYDDASGTEHTLSMNYLNVPVLLQYNFNNGFRLQGGPQVGFLLNAKDKVGDASTTLDTDNFNTVDFSVPVGLSYLSYAGFGVDARYNIGVTKVADGNNNLRNSVFQFGVFYLFDHKHKAKSR